MAHDGRRRSPGRRTHVVPRRRARRARRARPLSATTTLPALTTLAARPLTLAAARLDDGAHAEPAHDYVALLTAAPPRVLAYVAILLTVGAAVWGLWVVPRSRRAAAADPAAFARAHPAVARVAAVGAAAGLLAAAWQLAVQLSGLGGGTDMLAAVVVHTRWGQFLAAQAAAFGVAALGFWAARNAARRGRWSHGAPGPYRLAAGAAAAAAAAQAGLGHAAADEAAPVLALVAGSAHVLGVAAWLGTLAVLAVVWFAMGEPPPDPVDALLAPVPSSAELATRATAAGAALGPLHLVHDGAGGPDARRGRPPAALVAPQVAAFSRVALASAGLVLLTGAVSAWLRLAGTTADAAAAARLGALVGSRYGWLLLAKLALVAAVAAVGAFNWRRGAPRAAAGGDVTTLERATRVELGVALGVLVLSAALALTSPPGSE